MRKAKSASEVADRVEEMGYDGVRALEALPELLGALEFAAHPPYDLTDGAEKEIARTAQDALAPIRKEP